MQRSFAPAISSLRFDFRRTAISPGANEYSYCLHSVQFVCCKRTDGGVKNAFPFDCKQSLSVFHSLVNSLLLLKCLPRPDSLICSMHIQTVRSFQLHRKDVSKHVKSISVCKFALPLFIFFSSSLLTLALFQDHFYLIALCKLILRFFPSFRRCCSALLIFCLPFLCAETIQPVFADSNSLLLLLSLLLSALPPPSFYFLLLSLPHFACLLV